MNQTPGPDWRIKTAMCFLDADGNRHNSIDDAVKANLERVLGKVGSGESMTPAIAGTIYAKADEIIAILQTRTATQGAAS